MTLQRLFQGAYIFSLLVGAVLLCLCRLAAYAGLVVLCTLVRGFMLVLPLEHSENLVQWLENLDAMIEIIF